MDLLKGYDSNSDQESDGNDGAKPVAAKVQRPDRRYLQAAPSVSIMTKRKHGHELIVRTDPSTNMILTEPVQGPQELDPSAQKFSTGKAEANLKFDEQSFKKQRTRFQREGKAKAPGQDVTVVRTTLGYNQDRLQKFELQEEERKKRPRFDKKEKEPLVYGSDDEAVYGVWAPPSKEEKYQGENSLTAIQKGGLESLEPEQLAEREYIKERDRLLGVRQEEKEEMSGFERLMERKMAHLLPPKIPGDSDEPVEPKTTFHGKAETDYKGQSWSAPPSGLASIASGEPLEMDHHKCFVPKKCVHRFTGHNKGVQRIRLFPKTGHLLLSAGLDGKCKVWSIADRTVMRTYEGHKAAVRDVQFNHDGSKFVSASFDRYLRLWDTESGQVLQTFYNKKVPYCVEFYPHDDNFFVVGYSDNKIVTYDATTGDITQEYNHHLAPVNSIVFVDDNGTTKMVSSSDDKKGTCVVLLATFCVKFGIFHHSLTQLVLSYGSSGLGVGHRSAGQVYFGSNHAFNALFGDAPVTSVLCGAVA
jgi:WD domain, G-beta repeat